MHKREDQEKKTLKANVEFWLKTASKRDIKQIYRAINNLPSSRTTEAES